MSPGVLEVQVFLTTEQYQKFLTLEIRKQLSGKVRCSELTLSPDLGSFPPVFADSVSCPNPSPTKAQAAFDTTTVSVSAL